MVLKTTTLIVLLSLGAHVAAYSRYLLQIPNANYIPGVKTPGHLNFTHGKGPRSPFGLAFAAANRTWTVELCRSDSDGDGATNGEELRDPCCTWNVNVTTPNTTIAANPGLADNYTAADLAALKCKNGTTTTAAPTTTPKPSSSVSCGLALAALAVAVAVQQN